MRKTSTKKSANKFKANSPIPLHLTVSDETNAAFQDAAYALGIGPKELIGEALQDKIESLCNDGVIADQLPKGSAADCGNLIAFVLRTSENEPVITRARLYRQLARICGDPEMESSLDSIAENLYAFATNLRIAEAQCDDFKKHFFKNRAQS